MKVSRYSSRSQWDFGAKMSSGAKEPRADGVGGRNVARDQFREDYVNEVSRRRGAPKDDLAPQGCDLAEDLGMQLEVTEQHWNARFRHRFLLSGEVIADFLRNRVEIIEQFRIRLLLGLGEHVLDRCMIAIHERDAKIGGHAVFSDRSLPKATPPGFGQYLANEDRERLDFGQASRGS